jgi:hypothetical protein
MIDEGDALLNVLLHFSRFSFSRNTFEMFQATLDVRRLRGQSRFVGLGDVALLKFAPATYRLCKVEQLLRDPQDGLVKTAAVKVARRPSHPGDAVWAAGIMEVPIHSLKVLLPARPQ